MNKKSALNISIEAILILIIAVVVLGLILGFVRYTFGRMQKNWEDIIAKEPDPATPTFNSPITISSELKTLQRGEASIIKVSVFNPTNEDWESDKGDVKIICKGELSYLDYETNPKPIASNDFETFIVKFKKVSKKTPDDTYLCSVQVPPIEPQYYKDLTLKVIG